MTGPRRSRRTRTPTGRRIALTSRDLAIFKALARYRYLPSTYLHAFAGGVSETRLKERLGDLFHEGFIDRPQKQWEWGQVRCAPFIYELDTGGKCCLDEYAEGCAEPVTFLGPGAHRQFLHGLTICQVLASIELAAARSPAVRFISWPEILARAPETTRMSAEPFRVTLSRGSLIPDGLFGLEYRSDNTRRYRFFALEVDRGTMPIVRSTKTQSAYVTKIAGYQEILARQLHTRCWGISTLLVATVTTSQARVANMMENVPAIRERPQFMFKAFTYNGLAAPAFDILGQEWLRPGHPAIRLDCEA